MTQETTQTHTSKPVESLRSLDDRKEAAAREPNTDAVDGAKANIDALRELLKGKCQEGTDLLTHYLRAFAIYVAVTGALLKFALDQQATKTLFTAMSLLGLSTSLLGLVMAAFGERVRRSIKRDIASLAGIVGAPELASNQLSLKYTLVSVVLFVLLVICGWIFLLVALLPGA